MLIIIIIIANLIITGLICVLMLRKFKKEQQRNQIQQQLQLNLEEIQRNIDEKQQESEEIQRSIDEKKQKSKEYDEQLIVLQTKLEGNKRQFSDSSAAAAQQLENLAKQKVQIEETMQVLKLQKERAEEYNKELIEKSQENISNQIQAFYEKEKNEYSEKLLKTQETLQRAAHNEFDECYSELQKKYNSLSSEILDFQKKRAVINEEILRQREIAEQEDFYKIKLDDDAREDIEILMNIRAKLNKRENLNKLIYDTYVSKPVQEMVKRVLKGGAPSGIYKITRLKTGEIYIGKSTDVKARWQQHCKTVFGVGTIAHSILHTTMERDGLENFTFELLEEVPKDKLGEKEKYWIDFYDSKKYGLNERAGG